MKFKLDENFGTRTQNVFRVADHEVMTVRDQGLQGAADAALYETCCLEKHCLVTLDLDFSDVLRFPPTRSAGIAVIRLPKNPSLNLLERLIREFLSVLTHSPIAGNLWIIEPGRIRMHQVDNPEEP